MTKPSEHFPDSENSSDGASMNHPKSISGVMINTGFREDLSEGSSAVNRKFFAKSQDRKNFIFIFLALVVFGAIFILLECKQSRDAKLEKESAPSVPAQTN